MTSPHPTIAVPYHLDEYLPGLDLPLRADQVITADLPSADVWDRLATLYGAVAPAPAARPEDGPA